MASNEKMTEVRATASDCTMSFVLSFPGRAGGKVEAGLVDGGRKTPTVCLDLRERTVVIAVVSSGPADENTLV